jgi:uncharacterized protein
MPDSRVSSPQLKLQRLEGFDLARSVAILGMIVVHFILVMTDGVAPVAWSDRLLSLLDGRPAATFVILAGIGGTLMSRKAALATAAERAKVKSTLRRRGLFLLACGFVNLTIWEGDILRLYGVSLIFIPWLLWRRDRTLCLAVIGFLSVFMVLLATFEYEKNWEWSTMTYHGLWTPEGLIRSLVYDGFRSVFPWTGLLVSGMWLGRLDWSADDVARKATFWGAAMILCSAVFSHVTLRWLAAHPQPGLDRETAVALFGLQSMPPLPVFLVNATGSALLVIGVSTIIVRRWPGALAVRALSSTGQMAFTWYMAHIVVGLGGVIALGWLKTIPFQAIVAGSTFFLVATMISLWLRQRSMRGPLEVLLRRL